MREHRPNCYSMNIKRKSRGTDWEPGGTLSYSDSLFAFYQLHFSILIITIIHLCLVGSSAVVFESVQASSDRREVLPYYAVMWFSLAVIKIFAAPLRIEWQ